MFKQLLYLVVLLVLFYPFNNVFSATLAAYTDKETPADADVVIIADSEDNWETKNLAVGSIGVTNLDNNPGTDTIEVTSSNGSSTILPAATTSTSGVLTSSDKTKIDNLDTAAYRAVEDTLTDGSNIPDGAAIKLYGDINWEDIINLSYNQTSTYVTIIPSNGGTSTNIPLATDSLAGLLSPAGKTALEDLPASFDEVGDGDSVAFTGAGSEADPLVPNVVFNASIVEDDAVYPPSNEQTFDALALKADAADLASQTAFELAFFTLPSGGDFAWSSVPQYEDSAGDAGSMAYDNDNLYIKTATIWKTVALVDSLDAAPTTYTMTLTIVDDSATGDTFTVDSVARSLSGSPYSITGLSSATEAITYNGSNLGNCTGTAVTGTADTGPWAVDMSDSAEDVTCTITTSGLTCSDTAFLDQTTGSNGYQITKYTTQNAYGGARFTPAINRSICKIRWNIQSANGTISTFTYRAKIYELDVNGDFTGSALGVTSSVAGSDSWSTTDIETPFTAAVSLTSGTEYAVVLFSDSGDGVTPTADSANNIDLSYTPSSILSNTNFATWADDGTLYYEDVTRELNFSLYEAQ